MTFSSTKSAILSALLVSAAVTAIQPARAETKATIQPAIQTSYNKINAAFVRKDVKAATAYFTPDYISINAKGEQKNLEEFRTHYSGLLNRFNIKLTSNKATIENIVVNPDGIDVAIAQRTEGTIMGGNKIVINQKSRDLWQKTPQGWRLKQSKIVTEKTTFNGKTFSG